MNFFDVEERQVDKELQYSGKYDFAYDFAALRDKAATRINDVLHTGVVEGNFDSVAHALTVSRVILATALSSEFDIYSGKWIISDYAQLK